MILPNMLWGGLAHYPSDVLPPSAQFRKYGDQIEQMHYGGQAARHRSPRLEGQLQFDQRAKEVCG